MQPESDLEFAAGEGAAVAADEEDDVVAVAPEAQGAAPVDGVAAPAAGGQGEFEGGELFFGEAVADRLEPCDRSSRKRRLAMLDCKT